MFYVLLKIVNLLLHDSLIIFFYIIYSFFTTKENNYYDESVLEQFEDNTEAVSTEILLSIDPNIPIIPSWM